FEMKNVLSVPLEAVTAEGNVSYVYKRNGGAVTKQEVETGALNDTHIVVVKGVNEGDEGLLVPPTSLEGITVNRLTRGDNVSPKDSAASKAVPIAPQDKKPAAKAPAAKDSGKQ